MNTSGSSLGEVLSAPKGGGAVRGIGETFQPDLHTGTGNFSVPIAVPEGRSGLQPALALTFSTGNGNGPFGLGWKLGLPALTCLTSKGLPRYAGEDTFILAGAEELVRLGPAIDGVTTYRPRTEGLFARISHITQGSDHWEVATKDGRSSFYGPRPGTPERFATLADPDRPTHRFAWHLTETRDPFGNRIVYDYRRDTDRRDGHNGVQTYLKTIRYVDLPGDGTDAFLVSVEFLYDDDPPPHGLTPEVAIKTRPDPFSDHRAGFEIHTSRRCKWIIVRTHPAGSPAVPVRAYEFIYRDEQATAATSSNNGLSLLTRISVIGFDDDGRAMRELPPLDFSYSAFEPASRRFRRLEGPALPTGSLSNPDLELVDLFGNGLPDLLELSASGARCWRNMGRCRFDWPKPLREVPAGLALADRGVQIIDADGDGRADLMVSNDRFVGDYPLDFTGRFNPSSFRRYAVAPTFDLEDPQVRLLDLTGDGITDVLRTGDSFECFFSDKEKGFAAKATRQIPRGRSPDFPDVSFADPRVKLADLSGDGLQDIVLVHASRVDYWPNLGYGRFGSRLTMVVPAGLPPQFDPERVLLGDIDGDGLADLIYISDREVTLWLNRAGNGWSQPVHLHGTPPVDDIVALRLVDLEGTGVAGLLWTRQARLGTAPEHYFLDFTGGTKPYLLTRMDNNLGAVTEVSYSPSTTFYLRDQADPATRWRTTMPYPVHVVERVTVRDALSDSILSTEYRYHHGYNDGVEKEFRGYGMVEQIDTEVFGSYLGRKIAGDETALRRLLDQRHHSPPTLTRTWFHQGAVDPADGGPWQELEFRDEYWAGDRDAAQLPYLPVSGTALSEHKRALDAFLMTLTRAAQRDALRSLRGSVLRREIYALDGSDLQNRPYTVSEYAYAVREIDTPSPIIDRRHIFHPYLVAERTTQWERGDDPMSRYTFNGDHDAHGQPRLKLDIACPRGWRNGDTISSAPYLAALTKIDYAASPEGGPFLADRIIRSRSFELTDTEGATLKMLLTGHADWPRRLFAETLMYYDGPAFQGLPFGQIGDFGVLVRSEVLVLDDASLTSAYGSDRPPYLDEMTVALPTDRYPAKFVAQLPTHAGYVRHAKSTIHSGGRYAQTSRAEFDFQVLTPPSAPRGLVLAQQDPLGHTTRIDAIDYLYGLLPLKVTGPTGLVTRAEYNMRVLQASALVDPNGNLSEFRYSSIGLPTETFVRGKPNAGEGDEIHPSLSFRYDLRAFYDRGQPALVHSVQRIFHDTDPADTGETVAKREYSDGFGRLLQTRLQGADLRFGDATFGGGEQIMAVDQRVAIDQRVEAPQELVGATVADPARPNVVVSGWQRYDNKGHVVERYEPFFDTGWDYQPVKDAQLGRAVRTEYDPRGQVVRTVSPDGSEQRIIYGIPKDLPGPPLSPTDATRMIPTPWEVYTYDANDNAGRTHAGSPFQAGYRHHHDTPSSIELDALGRTVRAVARHRSPVAADGIPPPIEEHVTRSSHDIRGNVITIRDALGRKAFEHLYDLAGRPLRTTSIDAGQRQTVFDAAGRPVEQRDSKGACRLYAHDPLGRPRQTWARDSAAEPVSLRERSRYGEASGLAATAAARNQLGRLVTHDDEAGRVEISSYDFKGNALRTTRQVLSDDALLAAYRAELARPAAARTWALPAPRIDWNDPDSESRLGAIHSIASTYDALGRVVSSDYPTAANGNRYRVQPGYNRAGALESVSIIGPLDPADDGPSQSIVRHIAYDAKGQRILTVYGNGIATRQVYDPATLRLARVRTERCDMSGTDPTTCRFSGPPLRDIAYRYDLVGNILTLQDLTPGCGVRNNPEALAAATELQQRLRDGDALIRRFSYDPLYRVTSASGRESRGIPDPRPWHDLPREGFNGGNHGTPDQNNAPELTTAYRENYDYDAAGNLLTMEHRRFDSVTGWQKVWSRRFGMDGRDPEGWSTEVVSHIRGGWDDAPTNRLTHVESRASGLPTPPSVAQTHWYDANGNLIRENTERRYEWDHADRLSVFRNQTGTSRPTTYALYLYDSTGMRIKKLVVDGGARYRTTTYIGTGFEHHTEQRIDGSDKQENCSLHIMDGVDRIAIKRVGPAFDDDGAADHPVQYHLADHLGSSAIVVSDDRTWMNREELYVWGECAFGSFGRKRFRFTGKERDEESGLTYHGARYYAPWIVRWTACDPAFIGPPVPGTDDRSANMDHSKACRLYTYVSNRPVDFFDPDGKDEKKKTFVIQGYVGRDRLGEAPKEMAKAVPASRELVFQKNLYDYQAKQVLRKAGPGDVVVVMGHANSTAITIEKSIEPFAWSFKPASGTVSATDIETAFSDGSAPDLVIFAGCNSLDLAKAAQSAGVKVAIGTSQSLTPLEMQQGASIILSELANGKTLAQAVDAANLNSHPAGSPSVAFSNVGNKADLASGDVQDRPQMVSPSGDARVFIPVGDPDLISSGVLTKDGLQIKKPED